MLLESPLDAPASFRAAARRLAARDVERTRKQRVEDRRHREQVAELDGEHEHRDRDTEPGQTDASISTAIQVTLSPSFFNFVLL